MKPTLLIMILLLALGTNAGADDAKTAFDTAVGTYQAGKFGEAHDQFTRLNSQFGPHPTYAFNAGNAAHAAGQLPEAALRYQEALELDPNLEAARKNLALVQTEAQAMAGSLEGDQILPRVSMNLLVVMATITLWLGIALAAMAFARLLQRRSGGGWMAVSSPVLLGVGLGLCVAASHKWDQHRHQQVGVVFSPAAAYSDIAETGSKIADLKPATSVLVKSKRGNHVYALLPNGQHAWMPASALQLVPPRESMAIAK